MINICIYHFKVFRNRKYEGLKISYVAMLKRPVKSGDFSYKHGFALKINIVLPLGRE
jgi:hypothetical protein